MKVMYSRMQKANQKQDFFSLWIHRCEQTLICCSPTPGYPLSPTGVVASTEYIFDAINA